ncbi:MAG: rhodanese-like domain-containing protein [Campylobacterales bacterium]|nr:rhodanese-like domain-containing protein [Campylobacterales bacterium]
MIEKNMIYLILLGCMSLYGGEGLEYQGVPMKVTNGDGKEKTILVKRHIPDECAKIPITNETVWTGNYANTKVPQACKSTFVHTSGHLQPIQLDEDIETYGELEVLAFIKDMKNNNRLMLIDARNDEWYEYRTIPGAINMPYPYFQDRTLFKEEFEYAMKMLDVKILKDNEFDFDNAKTILVFCNGPWCGQSSHMINALLEIGYPPENIKWYRGGIQDWLGAGMTSMRD